MKTRISVPIPLIDLHDRAEPAGQDVDPDKVIAWYTQKTESVLKKYGPGPRVHFHVGIFDRQIERSATDSEAQRQILVASQERLLRRAAHIWDAAQCLQGSILDVGCGLGGGALFWAQEYGCDVTAITIVPEHISIVKKFADQAGVADRVHPILADACEVQTPMQFSAAIAIESSCYLPRTRWFQHLSTLLRPDGHVCIEDSFFTEAEWAKPFNDYWHTNVGCLQEYVDAAAEAGFVLDRNEDITREVEEFWRQSIKWTELWGKEECQDLTEWARLKRSIQWQSDCRRAWRERGIETRLLRFSRDG